MRGEAWHGRARTIQSLVSFINGCARAGTLLTSEEAVQIRASGRIFPLLYQSLAEQAEASGACLWKVRPKLHYFAHVVEDVWTSRENPGRLDTFDWESFVGKIKKIASKTHRATVSKRTLQRYLLFLACRWHRGVGD